MKKNKMMRLASSLLVAVLLTSSVISGTFAKYVTEDSATDSARVAKFGVTVKAQGSLFSDTYIDAPATTGDLTVISKGGLTDKVVAPGTNGGNGITFTIDGTPEVDVKVVVDVLAEDDTETPVEIFLKKDANLPDMTTGNETDVFENTNDYYPVEFTLKKNGTVVPGADGVTLAKIKEVFEGLYVSKFNANEYVGAEYNLTWAWDFGVADADPTREDKCDTLLGDLAAGTATIDSSLYNLTTNVKVVIRVEQVD